MSQLRESGNFHSTQDVPGACPACDMQVMRQKGRSTLHCDAGCYPIRCSYPGCSICRTAHVQSCTLGQRIRIDEYHSHALGSPGAPVDEGGI